MSEIAQEENLKGSGIRPKLSPETILGPLYTETSFKDIKDPCIVFDGITWHIYGSGGDVINEVWHILHATAPEITGPWKEIDPVVLIGIEGEHIAAPSVYYEPKDHTFHMMVQNEFMSLGGTIEYLCSPDGHTFTKVKTALTSLPETSEAGIYDPHQTVIGDKKYITYAGTRAVADITGKYRIQPEVHLAEFEPNDKKTSWSGSWNRHSIILGHKDIAWHHNQPDHPEYEWGIEGPQIIELPDGKFLLNATCFLPGGEFTTRQRVFFAIADEIKGPYKSLGPVIDPKDYKDQEWLSGENGHASAIIKDDKLYLFFQARRDRRVNNTNNNWRYGIAIFPLTSLKI